MASISRRSSGRWQARVSMNGKAHSIGTFATKKEAQEKAYIFENEVKPHLMIPDVEKILEDEIAEWKSNLEQIEQLKTDVLKYDYSLEKLTIKEVIEKLEKSLRVYKNQKKILEEQALEKVSRMISGGI